MMRFLKAKFIIPALLLILIIVVVMLYFVGALKASAQSFDNIPFDISKFIDANDVDELDVNKFIADTNENDPSKGFKMYFNEVTTVVSIEDKATHKVYTTAIPSTKNATTGEFVAESQDTGAVDGGNNPIKEEVTKKELLSNFILYYLKSDGTESGMSLNVIENSVNYKNALIDEFEKHYSFYENADQKFVQVCYDIGNFTSTAAYFPRKVKQSDWLELLRGNIRFEENVTQQRTTQNISYTGRAYCYSEEVLEYLQDNDLIYWEDYDGDDYDDEKFPIEKPGYYIVYLAGGTDSPLYNSYGTHLNCEGSPLNYNPFFGFNEWESLVGGAYYRSEQTKSIIDDDGNPLKYYTIGAISTAQAKRLYVYLYKAHVQTIFNGTEDLELAYDNGDPVIRGGFQARDEHGNYLYEKDDNGNLRHDEEGNLIPVQAFYTFDMVAQQDAFFGIDEDLSLPAFRIALQFKLVDNGLEISIIHDSIIDSSNWKEGDDPKYNAKCKIARIEVTPMISSSYITTENAGSIILPDGCGAVIEFNNHAEDRGASAYNNVIYGSDESFLVNNLTAQTPDLMFPMYGFLANAEQKGIMAVVTNGASLTSIIADSTRAGTPYNYAKFMTYMRELEKLEIAYGWYRYKIDKWADDIYPADFVYNYTFLEPEDLDYSSLAEIYRAFICDQYGIDPAGRDNTTKTVVNLNIVGAYRHYQLTLGIIYYRKSALTSFDQAEQMIQELLDQGLKDLTVSYKGWTQDALEYKLRRNFSISGALGGKKDMQDLSKFLEANNIDFYPELNIAKNKGYKYGFGNSKYTARGVGNVPAKEYQYDLSKLQYDKKSKPTYLVSPKYYQQISSNLLKSFSKSNADGVYLIDLGNEKIGDYRKYNLSYAETNKYYQMDAMKYWADHYKVQLDHPFDFGIASASSIVGAPLTTTLEPIIDYSIPFYQLVLSGLVDYSMEIINGTNDNSVEWYLAKAAETGSNLNFQVAYKDNSILLETDYTQYYRVHFDQWKDTIVDMTNRLNSINIHDGSLEKHEVITVDGLRIAKVKYTNGVQLYVNTNSRDVIYDGKTIKAYSWYVL